MRDVPVEILRRVAAFVHPCDRGRWTAVARRWRAALEPVVAVCRPFRGSIAAAWAAAAAAAVVVWYVPPPRPAAARPHRSVAAACVYHVHVLAHVHALLDALAAGGPPADAAPRLETLALRGADAPPGPPGAGSATAWRMAAVVRGQRGLRRVELCLGPAWPVDPAALFDWCSAVACHPPPWTRVRVAITLASPADGGAPPFPGGSPWGPLVAWAGHAAAEGAELEIACDDAATTAALARACAGIDHRLGRLDLRAPPADALPPALRRALRAWSRDATGE